MVVVAIAGIVLVPEPHIAVEAGLVVHAELEHVDLVVEQFLGRSQQRRMRHESIEDLAVQVRVDDRADRGSVLFEHESVGAAVAEQQLFGFANEHACLDARQQTGAEGEPVPAVVSDQILHHARTYHPVSSPP